MKNKIYYITNNQNKINEFDKIIEQLNIDFLSMQSKKIDVTEIKSLSQEEVVINKSLIAYSTVKNACICDDTCLYIDGFDLFPGTYTKFLKKCLGIDGILKLIDNNTPCIFKTMLCLKSKKTILISEGTLNGVIRYDKLKNSDKNTLFSLNDIFYVQDLQLFLSDISVQERALFSHRQKAIIGLLKKVVIDYNNIF